MAGPLCTQRRGQILFQGGKLESWISIPRHEVGDPRASVGGGAGAQPLRLKKARAALAPPLPPFPFHVLAARELSVKRRSPGGVILKVLQAM